MGSDSKKLLLTVAGVVLIAFYLNISYYETWMEKKVVKHLKDISFHLEHMDLEERRVIRFGSTYALSADIRKYLVQMKQDTNALVLMPPKTYFQKMGVDFYAPEPIVFYYFSGLKSKWINSPGVEKCNYALGAQGKGLNMAPINDTAFLHKILAFYNQFPAGL